MLPLGFSCLAAPPSLPPLLDHIGGFHCPVSTLNRQAQAYFDQGLACVYGYQYTLAHRSFQAAASLDPDCAMAYWGMALADGPSINWQVEPDGIKDAVASVAKAEKAAHASPLERQLIAALSSRYAIGEPDDRSALDRAYADAMRTVWAENPRNADVGALFADALIDLHPWKQWTLDGKPTEGTLDLLTTLRQVLKINPNHPHGLHLMIHALEGSPRPADALFAADRLNNLQPDLAHMQHMPSHIYVKVGLYQKAIDANVRSLASYDRLLKRFGKTSSPGPHGGHVREVLAVAAAMCGQSQTAIRDADAMVIGMTPKWLEDNGRNFDPDVCLPIEVRKRFGRWQDLLDAPDYPASCPIARTIRLGDRAVAYAATGNLPRAQAEQAKFEAAFTALGPSFMDDDVPAQQVLAVQRHLVSGELLIHDPSRTEDALNELRESVRCEDALRYSEPPDWLQPARHALGAALVQTGRFKEAEDVYREDLRRWPNNGWSLYGLSRALVGQKRPSEAAAAVQRFKRAWASADVTIGNSCLCLSPG